MTIQGLHHITLVTADAQRNIDFYTRTLGLRFIKKTVNFDDPGSYHLYYGDETGRPGTAVTFFEWRGAAHGRPGIGGTHHFALSVADANGLLKWKRRLADLGMQVSGPLKGHDPATIAFKDPDGTLLEIAAQELSPDTGQTLTPDGMWPDPVPGISPDMALSHGMHHITAISSDIEHTHLFFGELLGLQQVKLPGFPEAPGLMHWGWGVDGQRPILTYFEQEPGRQVRVQMGAGQTHHFALCVPDEDTQLQWREKLAEAGLRVTPVIDRVYFKSIYTNDPDGHIVELATAGPGFLVDEDDGLLGQSLQLPPWLEEYRYQIETTLEPVTTPGWPLTEVAL